MKAEWINPFISSAIRVFAEMLNTKISRGKPGLSGARPEHHVSGVIGLTGDASGLTVVSFDRAAALFVTGTLLGSAPTSIDSDVTDAVAEMTNMIAGCAKAQLADLNMALSLPTVVTGRNHVIAFPYQIQPIVIPFDCPVGKLSIQVGLTEQNLGGNLGVPGLMVKSG